MWIYDGENWTDEGTSSDKSRNPEPRRQQPTDEFQPEMQIVEIPVTPREIPPFPIAIPVPMTVPILRRKK